VRWELLVLNPELQVLQELLQAQLNQELLASPAITRVQATS
jgi:hypothetical protein